MKKRFWLVLLLVVGLMLYLESFRGTPPEPDVSVNGTDIAVTSGSSCWKSLLNSKCIDLSETIPLDMTAEQTPTIVKPGEKIDVAFNDGPSPTRIKAEQWQKGDTKKTIRLKNEQITAPSQKGLYIYHVYAWWKKGDGNVAFPVLVK
ncbi:hypothetical protein [Exiguobacterium artemiae]|uniref:hypothetical protein n=1 Tax=Exiguobacterium artemiae TaxID=340145 RepID=UPI0029643A6B|nr:hypothetical protein [Exiguobacterium sibiricum]MDW2885381.1 hypothetical protein [Exiguobacterium sibiricum]